GKYRLGLTGGVRERIFHSPFSAPFGGFVFLKEDIRIPFIDRAIQLLIEWTDEHNLSAINITLPPPIYQQRFIAKQINSFYRAGFMVSVLDLNYTFDLNNFSEDYLSMVWRNARKNLLMAFKQDLEFKKCNSAEEKHLAYEVIRKNRISKGFPLRMSWVQVQETTKLIQADFFLVFDEAGNPVASAIVFHVSDKIVQVIYWGDNAAAPGTKAMNFLSYKIFEYYKNLEIKIIDIGPSTENSMPNYGLCEFKESIGCEINIKFTCSKTLRP
ncbi:MAG: hypothetical protein JXQ65_15445, partial [Candidatus Marinimicrobia bacterium]|nr:hypothetical protein [Candidatus Neomarinimicrobiota bacterium]